jgi:hypothetical protein
VSTALLALGLAAACASRPAATPAGAAEQAGTVVRVGDFGFGIVPDADPGTRYAPEGLPRELEVEGLRVVFTGVVSSPPADVRMWGVPLRLTSIRRAP